MCSDCRPSVPTLSLILSDCRPKHFTLSHFLSGTVRALLQLPIASVLSHECSTLSISR